MYFEHFTIIGKDGTIIYEIMKELKMKVFFVVGKTEYNFCITIATYITRWKEINFVANAITLLTYSLQLI